MLSMLIALLAVSVLSLGDMHLNAVNVTLFLPRAHSVLSKIKQRTIST